MSSANIHKLQQADSKLENEGPRHTCKLILDLGRQKAQDFHLVEPWAATVLCSLAQSSFFLSISWSPSPLLLDLSSLRIGVGPRFPCLQGGLKMIWICLEMLMNSLEGKDSGCYGFVAYRYQNQNHHPSQIPKDWIHLTWSGKVS